MDWHDHIERQKDVMLGKPVFKGTRLTVEFILDRLSHGATEQDLLENYVGLTHERVLAAMAFAAAMLRNEEAVAQS